MQFSDELWDLTAVARDALEVYERYDELRDSIYAFEAADGDVPPDRWADLGDAGREAADAMEPVLRKLIDGPLVHLELDEGYGPPDRDGQS